MEMIVSRRRTAFFLAALAFLLLFSGCIAEADNGTEGDPTPNCVDMYLPCSPETGCFWDAWAEDENIVEIRETFFENNSNPGIPGVGGIHWFHLNGLSEGMTSVMIAYLRPWEINSPEIVFVYRLHVDAAGNVMIRGMEMNDMRFVSVTESDGDLTL